MPDVSYVPGALTAVAGGWCLALIEASPDSPVVARIWAQVGQGAQPDAVLGGLLADGLDSVPGFVLLAMAADGTPRLFCRGAVGATVYGGGAGRIDGAGLLTWREQVVTADATRIVLGEPPDGGALRLPAASGVLLAGCVIVDLAGSASSDAGLSDAGLRGASSGAAPQGDAEDIIKTIVLDTGAQPTPPHNPAGQPAGLNPAGLNPAGLNPAGQSLAGQSLAGQSHVAESPAAHGPVVQGTVLKDTVNQGAVLPDTVTDAPVAPVVVPGPGEGQAASSNGYPDTITMTTPGSMAGNAPAPPAPAPPAPAPPGPGAPQPWGAPPESAWPGSHPGSPPLGAPLPGVPPVAPPSVAPPSAGPSLAGPSLAGPSLAGPSAAGPVIAPGGPVGPPPGMPLPQMPAPARAPGPPAGVPGQSNPPGQQGPPGGLIDVPPWLAAPGAPTPAGGMPAWAPQPPPPQPSQPQRGDAGPGESGATLQRADLAGLVTAPPDRIGPVLPALICPAGHVNPPSGAACRRCGATLPHDPVPVPRPVLGVLRLSLGGVITLDRGVIMGRNPRADFDGPDGEERPHVVRLPSADGDISRNHVRVDLDGWHVLVTDLNSTNGTLVTLPGRDPQQLRPGEPVPIQPNTVVTLADGIDFRYEVTE